MSFTITIDSESSAKALYAFLRTHWRAAAERGAPLVVVADVADAPATSRQRRRYHALLRTIAAAAWVDGRQFDHDWWHDRFARMFVGVDRAGRPLSTAEITVSEMNDLMGAIEHHATAVLHLELDIP